MTEFLIAAAVIGVFAWAVWELREASRPRPAVASMLR